MNIPEMFKYGNIISVPLFGIIAYFLQTQAVGHSISRNTISHTITYLKTPFLRVLFRLNFILKAVLDFVFAIYLLDKTHLSFFSFPGILLVASALLFGSLAYFVEGKSSRIHIVSVYTSGILWAIGQFLIIVIFHDMLFSFLSFLLITIPIGIAFYTLSHKKTNVYVQILCISMWYLYTLLLVFFYL